MFNIKNQQKGFSFIELLVVIAIIIVLATISVLALNSQRAKARDAKRISDVKRVTTALEFYYSDEGEYPIQVKPAALGLGDQQKLCSKLSGDFVAAQIDCGEAPVYMELVPRDPLPGQELTYTGIDDGYDVSFTTEKNTEYGPPGVYHVHSESVDTSPGNR